MASCRHPDHEALQPAAGFQPRQYPKPDGRITFDMTALLYRSGTNHEHDQPSHLQLRNKGLPTAVNLPIYAGPESRYCPAGEGHHTSFSHCNKRVWPLSSGELQYVLSKVTCCVQNLPLPVAVVGSRLTLQPCVKDWCTRVQHCMVDVIWYP